MKKVLLLILLLGGAFLLTASLAPQTARAKEVADVGDPLPVPTGRQPAHTASPSLLPDSPPAPGAILVDDRWMMPTGSAGRQAAAPAAVGGPDDFGYTWNDAVPLNWIDATAGQNTGLSQSGSGVSVTGAISLGFNFPFYENSYSSVYIGSAGALGFDYWSLRSSTYVSGIPSPARVNNYIAPYLAPLALNAPAYGYHGGVYYLRGGTAPNRYFVAQWNQVTDTIEGTFTFQAILYESGDIRFQYRLMDHGLGYYCSTAVGIEDSRGIDGLSYLSGGCRQVDFLTNEAILFERPAPSARVQLFPDHYGTHIEPGATAEVALSLKNTGDLGSDRYDFGVPAGWQLDLYHDNGTTPLTDTNGNGLPDTGLLAQNQSETVVAVVHAPDTASPGAYQTFNVDVRSEVDNTVAETAMIRAAVPAPFAQIYRSDEDNGAMGLYLAHPSGQRTTRVGSEGQWGFDPAIAETPNHNFVQVYADGYCLDAGCDIYVYELYYTLVDQFGDVVVPTTKLTSHRGATNDVYDQQPAVAVAPDGTIGISWYRRTYDDSSNEQNYNIWFALLDPNGQVAQGPLNVTQNNKWGEWSDLHIPRLTVPQIVATGDNRFFLAWHSEQLGTPTGSCSSYCRVDDIYYTVYDASGTLVRAVTKLTQDTAGYDRGYTYPALTALTGQRVLVGFVGRNNSEDLYYAVVGSNGTVVRGSTNLSNDGYNTIEFQSDFTQLANGNIVAAWLARDYDQYPEERIRYAVIDNGYAPVAAPTTLATPGALHGVETVSLTHDGQNRAIATWYGPYEYRPHLYYALLGANGNLVTPATIFKVDNTTTPYLFSSYTGYGNTTYSWTPPEGVDMVLTTAANAGGEPGGGATLPVTFQNRGAAIATNVQLTLDLAPSGGHGPQAPGQLTYLGDTSGVTPTVSGTTVTWSFPGMHFLEEKAFNVYLGVPAEAAYGDLYPLAAGVATDEADVSPADNDAAVTVIASYQTMLPLVTR